MTRPTRTTKAFTLPELLVAIAAVALLTVGIGQLFQSISRLVGSGAALAETDQMARSIEDQMRRDFGGLSSLSGFDAFLAIRNRRVQGVYLTLDDQEADLRSGIAAGDDFSLAFDTRLDEIMFPATGGGGANQFTTAQVAPPGFPSIVADAARIYYGHGLRPAREQGFDPDNPDSPTSNVQQRLFLPDGDFGQRAGDANRFNRTEIVGGRNQFAGDWLVVRHAMLLSGGEVFGTGAGDSIFDPDLAVAPYVRPFEAIENQAAWSRIDDSERPWRWPAPFDQPNARLLYHGRTDVCAQSLSEMRQWLEGIPDQSDFPLENNNRPDEDDGTAFTAGVFDDQQTDQGDMDPFSNPDAPLYEREYIDGDPEVTILTNARRVQQAIAGMFTRYEADNEPPVVDRRDTLSFDPNASPRNLIVPDPPSAALMDLHATIGTNCSRLEIAWSDGTTWTQGEPWWIDLDDDNQGAPPGDPDPDDRYYYKGDIVWFDIDSPYRNEFSPPANDYAGEALTDEAVEFFPIHPELFGPNYDTVSASGAPGMETRRTGIAPYVVDITNDFARITASVSRLNNDLEDEYLAIWGFRSPDAEARYSNSRPWVKPTLIRVRVTLHDSQLRFREGKQYEFIFNVGLDD